MGHAMVLCVLAHCREARGLCSMDVSRAGKQARETDVLLKAL